jgi:hypothetical protein
MVLPFLVAFAGELLIILPSEYKEWTHALPRMP